MGFEMQMGEASWSTHRDGIMHCAPVYQANKIDILQLLKTWCFTETWVSEHTYNLRQLHQAKEEAHRSGEKALYKQARNTVSLSPTETGLLKSRLTCRY